MTQRNVRPQPIFTLCSSPEPVVYKCIECGTELPERFMPGSGYIRWFCDPCLTGGADSKARGRD